MPSKPVSGLSIPRLYAAASLKRRILPELLYSRGWYSAALCRGLIEAFSPMTTCSMRVRYSAALCRGLIEAAQLLDGSVDALLVFRGSMPRPH